MLALIVINYCQGGGRYDAKKSTNNNPYRSGKTAGSGIAISCLGKTYYCHPF